MENEREREWELSVAHRESKEQIKNCNTCSKEEREGVSCVRVIVWRERERKRELSEAHTDGQEQVIVRGREKRKRTRQGKVFKGREGIDRMHRWKISGQQYSANSVYA